MSRRGGSRRRKADAQSGAGAAGIHDPPQPSQAQRRALEALLNEAAIEATLRRARLEALNAELRTAHLQESALARLSRRAISVDDIDALLGEAAAIVADTLGTEFGLVAEFLPDGRRLGVRAGHGWPSAVVGRTLSADDIAPLLQSSEPVLVPDARVLTWGASFAEALGVQSWGGLAIPGEGRSWGLVLGCDPRARAFLVQDGHFLEALASLLALVVGRDRMRRERQREHESLEAIFANIPVLISVYDAEGRLVRVNPEWERTLGWSLDEARQLDVIAQQYADPAELERVRSFMRRSERRWDDFRPRTRDGRYLNATWMRVTLPDGSRIGFGLDITTRKAEEDERLLLLERERAARAQAEAALERLRAIQSITEPALSELGLDEMLPELLDRLRQVLASDSASVWLLDEEGRCLSARAAVGVLHPNLAALRLPLGQSISGLIAAEGRPRIIDDYGAIDISGVQGATAEELRTMAKSGMGAPLKVADRVIGVVGVTSATPRKFTEGELELLLLVAARVAPAVERGLLLDTVRAGRAQEKALAHRLLSAQEEERRRMAVELHDELGQALTAVKFTLESLARRTGLAELRAAIDSVDHTMDTVRDLAMHLRPPLLDDLGLSAALRWYADRFARETGLQIHLTIDAVAHLETGLETACFRVAQEALTNVVRHAHTRRVWIKLRLAAGILELHIREDGIGFDVAAARERARRGVSMGLLGMEERVALLGGRFDVLSRPGLGCEVRARFPTGPMPGGRP